MANVNFDFVEYNGLQYPVRTVTVFGAYRTVGPDILENVLMDEDGGYVDDNACSVDEEIACYVSSEVFFTYSDYRLGKYVEKEIYGNEPF